MTATTFEPGLRARLRRLASTTAVLAIAMGGCAFAAPSVAVAADTSSTDDDQNVVLHVSAGPRGVIAPGSSLSAILTVDNDTDSRLSSGEVRVELSRTPLTDRAAVSNWLDDGEAPGDFDTLGSEATDAVDAGASATTTIVVPDETLGTLAPGVYPLRAELSDAALDSSTDDGSDADASATSVLVVSAPQATQIGVLVPITATPADGALLTSDELAALTGAEGALTAQLDGVAGTTAVLAIDPAIVAAIRVLGSAAPESAREWLSRLDALPNARFALQIADADATAQSQAGLPELLQPSTFAPYLNPANFPQAPATAAPSDAPETTPAPTPDTTPSPALPTDEELTAIEGALPRMLWPDDELTTDDLITFAGYLGGPPTTIVSSDAVGGQRSAHATAGGQDLLVTDADASAALSEVASEADDVDRQRLLAEAAAMLQFAQAAAPGAPLLVGLDRDETRTAAALRDAITSADSVGFEFSALRATPPVAATVTGEPDTTRATAVSTLLSDESSLTAFSSILTDPQVLLSPERIRILRTLAVGTSDAAFAEGLAAHQARTTDTLAAVSIPPSSTIQLLAANADIPIAVRNDLPWPVTVRLLVSPTDPRLEISPVPPTVVQANSTTRVKVPVSARVGSGEVDLKVELDSPTGVQIQRGEIIRVAVRAEWETIGLVIFGGLAVVLIALGVIRTVRRKRREAIEEQAVEAAVDELIEEKEAEAAAQERDGRSPSTTEGPRE